MVITRKKSEKAAIFVVVTKKLVKFSVDLIERIIFHTDSPRLKSANGRGKLMLLERKDQRKSARKK